MGKKEIKERRTQLAGKSSQTGRDKNKKEVKMAKATKAKTEEKFRSAGDLAKMANVKPTVLRKCLHKHFAGRISTIKGANGGKQYQIKANDPIVKEILAKFRHDGDKPTDKGEGDKPSPEPLEIDLNKGVK